ncbi:low molecular weight protein arginine phosphatase [PVC group bacterium]|nr:low molecular weight protein arginine phosphatase [PVC group bacterium]
MNKRLILFVCTGNICRSPMAEYLFRTHLTSRPGWRVASAGVSAVNGIPASIHAIKALAEMGIDLRGHRSQALNRDLIDSASLVVVMTASHKNQVCTVFPDAKDKVHVLKSFADDYRDVEDPIGASLEIYKRIRDEIATALWSLDRYIETLNNT